MMYGSSRIVFLPVAVAAICAPAQALVYMSAEQAQQVMFPGRALTALPLALTADQVAAIEHDSGVKVYAGSLRAWQADDGGYLFIDAVIGKHDLITYAVALTAEGRVRQTEILEYREAYGGEVRNAHWRAQFAGRQHGDQVRIGRDIQNISGATLSCEHVTDGIRRLLATYAIAVAAR
jgi:Na+-translocating ferredoxin:NAD+ oxidoreductase RnfG subunit